MTVLRRRLAGVGVVGLLSLSGWACGDDSDADLGSRVSVDGDDADAGSEEADLSGADDTSGGDDSTDATDEAPPPETTVTDGSGGDEPPPTSSGAGDGPPEPTIGPDDAPPTTLEPPPGLEALCDLGLAMQPMTESFEELEDGDVGPVAQLYGELAALMLDHVSSLPPGPISDDTALLAGGLADIAQVLGEYDGPFAQIAADLEDDERLSWLFSEGNEYDLAGERWDAALDENCGLEL